MTKQIPLALDTGNRSIVFTQVNMLVFHGACGKIFKERERQNRMIDEGRIPHNCASHDVHPGIKLSVLAEEFGEVAKAMNDEASTDDLRAELIQVMAVAMAIYEGTFD